MTRDEFLALCVEFTEREVRFQYHIEHERWWRRFRQDRSSGAHCIKDPHKTGWCNHHHQPMARCPVVPPFDQAEERREFAPLFSNFSGPVPTLDEFLKAKAEWMDEIQ